MATNTDRERSSDAEPHSDAIERGRQLFESRNYKEALSVYLQLADTRYGRAIYLRIGWMYEYGMGTEKDAQKAEYWYEKAAKAGIPAGYYSLAVMRYRQGRHDEMRRLLERAAEQDYLPAVFDLGQLYKFGIGVPVDENKAYEYYEKAATQGHIFAERAIADKFIRGKHGLLGIPKGFFMIAKITWKGFRLKLKDPLNDRLRRFGVC